MHIAWFRETRPDPSNPFDDTASLIEALGATHAIDVVTEADAHDFVWRHARHPHDLCVYELANTPSHGFMWAYLLTYPGVLCLRDRTLHDSRAAVLDRHGRVDDYAVEFEFNEGTPPPRVWPGQRHAARGSWPMLRVPLVASRSVVVPDLATARTLHEAHPEARLRVAGVGVPCHAPPSPLAAQPVIGVLDPERFDVVERACARARDSGSTLRLSTGLAPADVLATCDVVLALAWPPSDRSLTAVLAGFAAGRVVVTFDLDTTADWPALDPQTWQPRGRAPAGPPVVVTIDPRDEEHSLVLTLRRLAMDGALRERLGAAARAWWREHATPAAAAATWIQILEEAATLPPPAHPADWPPHLTDDGTRVADAILRGFGLSSPTRTPARS